MPSILARSLAALTFVVFGLAVVAGCGPGAASGSPASLTVRDAWLRPPLGIDLPAAAYLTIVGGDTADALVGASSPVASSAEIHETMAMGSGMTGMQPTDEVAIPAGTTVTLAPGAGHLMLQGLTSIPAAGETVELTLTFRDADPVTIRAEVRAD